MDECLRDHTSDHGKGSEEDNLGIFDQFHAKRTTIVESFGKPLS